MFGMGRFALGDESQPSIISEGCWAVALCRPLIHSSSSSQSQAHTSLHLAPCRDVSIMSNDYDVTRNSSAETMPTTLALMQIGLGTAPTLTGKAEGGVEVQSHYNICCTQGAVMQR
jgi:hypothetical protein